jgi:hypothetical protein
MTQKILLIDWEFISTDTKGWYGFPVHAALVKEWLDSGKYDNEFKKLWKNMDELSMSSGSAPLTHSPTRLLISMLYWFYFKQQNYLGIKQYGEGFEDVYNSDPEMVEYLYSEYYHFFEKHYVFKVTDQIQRLIDRKPDDWKLGVISLDRTREEIELILSDKFSAIQEYRKIFTHRLCTDSPIRIYESATTPESVQFVSEEIDAYSLRDDLDVYILSNTKFKKHLYFPHKIGVIEIWGDKTIDDFNFNNPGQVLVESNIEKVSEHTENDPKKIAYPHDIVMGKFPSIQRVIDFYDNEGDLIGGVLMAYSLLVVLISTISEWLGLIDSYSDVIFYALGVPFLSWFAVMLSIIVFLLVTTVPVDTMNRYYKNKEIGLDTWDATWKAVKPVIIWTTILVLLGYIV